MFDPADSNLGQLSGKQDDAVAATPAAAPVAASGVELNREEAAAAAAAWLELLCSELEGTSRGVVMLRSGNHSAEARRRFHPAAHWPDSNGDDSRLLAVADAALEKGRTVVRPHAKPQGSAPSDIHDLAHPIDAGEVFAGVVALEVASCSEQRLPAVVRHLQSKASELASFLRSGRMEQPVPAGRGVQPRVQQTTSGPRRAAARRPKAAPEEAVPEGATAPTGAADKAAPPSAVPAKAAPDKTVPAQAAPAQAAPGSALESALWLVATCLEHDRFRGAATAVATEMAAQLGCERVAFGSLDGLRIEVQALSHSADFGDRMNLIRRIGAAMDEAVDQRATVVVPAPAGAPIVGSSAHEDLIKEEGSGAACTVLLPWNDDVVGAITLERPADRPFEPAEVQTLEDMAALLGPILELKRRDDRWLVRKAWDSCRTQARNLLGPRHLGLKAATGGLLALVAFLALATGMFRVTAPATLEGAVVRAAVAPIDGYIVEAPVRAGEVVNEGQVLAVLDDRVLRLEQRSWQSQRDQIESEFLEAMAERERVKMNVLRAGIEQADVQLELIGEQLARLAIVAPIDGVVVSGDLSQSIQAPVEQGDVLFEVAPLDAYRLMLRVDERDIAHVEAGQRGRVVLTALPETTHDFVVEKVTPVSTSEEGTNYFLVEAQIDVASELLRPGMEGVGKIDIEERKLIWILTRRITSWLRLWLWSWRGPAG